MRKTSFEEFTVRILCVILMYASSACMIRARCWPVHYSNAAASSTSLSRYRKTMWLAIALTIHILKENNDGVYKVADDKV